MLCLSLSGISLKIFSLSSYKINEDNNIIVSLDANNLKNILNFNTEKALKIMEYKQLLDTLGEDIRILYDEFKKIMMRKLIEGDINENGNDSNRNNNNMEHDNERDYEESNDNNNNEARYEDY